MDNTTSNQQPATTTMPQTAEQRAQAQRNAQNGEPTRSYVVLDGSMTTATGVVNVGGTVELTEKQAARALARRDIAEAGGEEARKASQKAEDQRKATGIDDPRVAINSVPYIGNTAGQPIAESDVPFNNTKIGSVLDGDKAELEARAARQTKAEARAKLESK